MCLSVTIGCMVLRVFVGSMRGAFAEPQERIPELGTAGKLATEVNRTCKTPQDSRHGRQCSCSIGHISLHDHELAPNGFEA